MTRSQFKKELKDLAEKIRTLGRYTTRCDKAARQLQQLCESRCAVMQSEDAEGYVRGAANRECFRSVVYRAIQRLEATSKDVNDIQTLVQEFPRGVALCAEIMDASDRLVDLYALEED